jgi:hypothetical protein
MHAYERQAYEMADGRYTPMGEVRLWEMYACERHAYEMAYARCTPVRETPMRWPMRDARLWDGFCEKHAYERRAYKMAAYERHAYEMVSVRNTSMRDASMRITPIRQWSMGNARL